MVIVFVCGMYWAADAMEMMIMSYLLPAAKQEFGTNSTVESVRLRSRRVASRSRARTPLIVGRRSSSSRAPSCWDRRCLPGNELEEWRGASLARSRARLARVAPQHRDRFVWLGRCRRPHWPSTGRVPVGPSDRPRWRGVVAVAQHGRLDCAALRVGPRVGRVCLPIALDRSIDARNQRVASRVAARQWRLRWRPSLLSPGTAAAR